MKKYLFLLIPLFSWIAVVFLNNDILTAPSKLRVKHLFTINGFSNDVPFVMPTGLYYDEKDGCIFVADAGRSEVGIFQKDGFLTGMIGKNSGLVEPIGIVIDSKSNIVVSDRVTGKILKFDFMGNPAGEFSLGVSASDAAPLAPGKIAMNQKGDLYALDRNPGRIAVFFDSGDTRIIELPVLEESSPDTLVSPADITIGRDGEIIVVDSVGNPVKIYDAAGRLSGRINKVQEKSESVKFAIAADVDAEGDIWLVDSFRHRVVVFARDGSVKFSFGGIGKEDGRFLFPIDIALDKRGRRVYVLEKDGKRLQAFSFN